MVRMADQLGVNHLPEPSHNVSPSGSGNLSEISLELLGFEDLVLTQRNVLGVRGPVRNPSAAA